MPPITDEPTPEREDEDDHDLLTYGEVRVRLHEEVRAQRALVAELESAGRDVTAAQRRLDALVDATDRNTRNRINDENFEKFFGYRGTARRNT
ncbi:acyl-CoA synthase [Janibacter sp. HTCC2649]|uniref:hypothetical protein n=1 Tax=Janibacter sp. HTCC2649 TaxID=313589 RepID=UPI0000670B5F|nr:hypothetical protein [Janibacter sp. HTCC2649]EAQ00595.1 acyl-CoA synthase [Janibacter sp. HTCC2649]